MNKVLCVLMCLLAVSMANALTITNGDLETGYVLGANIGGWASVTTGNFWDNAFWDSPPGYTPLVNMSINPSNISPDSTDPLSGAWFYQNIGAYAGEADVAIKLDWGSFDVNFATALRVALYEDTVGGFVQANDVDVEGALTLVGAQNIGGAVSGTDVVTFDLSGVGAGNNLFLRINNYNPGTGTQWTYADNISIVPEPATMALLGLGALVLRRKR